MGYLFLIGVAVLLIGCGIIRNATFEGRAKTGTYVFVAGAVMVFISGVDVMVRLVF